MKRTIIFFVLLALSLASMARPVSQDVARRVAQTWLQAQGMKNPAALQDITVQTPFTEFYVFAAPEGGFVLVSGDDCVKPVLAYSVENRFVTENMPENIRTFLDAGIHACGVNGHATPTANADDANAVGVDVIAAREVIHCRHKVLGVDIGGGHATGLSTRFAGKGRVEGQGEEPAVCHFLRIQAARLLFNRAERARNGKRCQFALGAFGLIQVGGKRDAVAVMEGDLAVVDLI